MTIFSSSYSCIKKILSKYQVRGPRTIIVLTIKYASSPLVATFDILQLTSFPAGFDQLIIYYVIIPSMILIGIIVGVILVARREHIHHTIMDIASSS
jgi:hypothetical protein